MNERIKLSITIINYRNRDGLRKTMDSVLCQTLADEYIIVDSGSDDGTPEWQKEYQSRYVELGIGFKWVPEKDNGIYHAMNKGVNMDQGDPNS